MIRLDSTTRKIEALLGGTVTTNQLNITSCWSDKTSSAYNGGTTVVNTNNTTAVTVVASPAASTVRDIDSIECYNADTVAATVTIRYNDNGTTYILVKTTLQTNETLIWTHGEGWKTVDVNGNTKNSIGGILPVPSGGTGDSSLTAHGILIGEGTSAVTVTAAMTSGQLLVGQGATSDPLPKTLSQDVTLVSSGAATVAGINTVALGSTTATSGNLLIASGSQWVSNSLSGYGTITSSGVITITKVQGTTAGGNAAAGDVGEFISSNVPVGSAVSMSTGVAKDVTSISLTAGDWDVWGNIGSVAAGGTTTTSNTLWISTTSATLPTAPNSGAEMAMPLNFPVGSNVLFPIGQMRINVSSTTTVYLSASFAFSGGTLSAYGFIGARRVR